MDKNNWDRAYEIKEDLWRRVHDLVDEVLVGEKPEIQETVRTMMTKQFRFWKRGF